ncbi:MAG: PAS domain S-box protein [Nitrospinae bacterium]|nr:PAS domain S-box protein [Nitrospinota bacterium]
MASTGKRKAAGKNSVRAAPRVSQKAAPSKPAKKPAASQKRLKDKDGNIPPALDTTGAIYAIGGVGAEITGIKKTEELLRTHQAELEMQSEDLRQTREDLEVSRAKYYDLYNLAPVGYFTISGRGLIAEANFTAASLLGMEKNLLIRQPFTRFIAAEHQDRYYLSHKELHETGKSQSCELRIARQNGVPFWARLEAAAAVDAESGAPVCHVAMIDITERVYAEVRMRLLQSAMDQADETVIITDPDGAIEYANAAAEKKSGYPLNALLGKPPRIFKSGIHDAAFYERLWRTIKSGHIWRGNIINRRADGSHYEEEVTISPVLGDGGVITHFIAIRHDITEQKMLRQQLIHAEKLSSIGTFVAGVAHELNNPLTAVIGFSNDLRQRTDLPEDLRHTLGVIADQSKRAVGVVKNLLSYSRPHKVERRTLDINKLLENTVGIHRYRLSADNIPVETAFASDPLPVYADAGQVQQVVVNILLNAQAAIKSAGADGVIRIATRRESKWMEDMAVITISNSGPPIPIKDIDRIFVPYFTTKGAGEGTGLGLYVAYNIVKDHQGELRAENLPGGGVAFHITFPASAEKRAATAPVSQNGKITPGIKVLVVDDEAPVRDWLTGMLLRHRVFAVGAGSVREAIEYLQNGSFDAIVSDYKMPEKDGIDLYGWLAEQRPETAKHFMFLTGAVEPRLIEFCEGQNLAALIKPVGEEAIIAAIAQMLAKEG